MTEKMIVFNVPGEVRGQGRPRTQLVQTKDGRTFTHIHEDKRDTANKYAIQTYAQEAMNRRGYKTLAEPTPDGLTVEILCYLKIPKSMPKKNVEKALRGEIRPMRKPDLDNVMKAVLDAMNQVVYRDDKDVTRATICRYYGAKERLSVRVTWNEREVV